MLESRIEYWSKGDVQLVSVAEWEEVDGCGCGCSGPQHRLPAELKMAPAPGCPW
jgi:hypothetical protein